MAIQIRMNAFGGENVIKTGNYAQIITAIEHYNASRQAKVNALFSCLSQAHQLNGPFKGECISAFEAKIYGLLKSDSKDEVFEATKGAKFAYDKSLEDVTQRVNYLVKNRFISNRENCYIIETKFSHHLNRIFKSLSGSSAGVGLGLITIGTLTFITAGITKLISSEETDGSALKLGLGVPIIVVGSILTAAPFVEALVKSGTDEQA